MKKHLALVAAVALAGCTLMPDYQRPPEPVPETLPVADGTVDAAGAPRAAELDWREFLADPRLQAVVEQALAGNRDLRVAALRVEKAGELLRIQRALLTPAVGAQAAGEIFRLPAATSESGQAETVEQYSVDLGFLSWEIDLFGRLRSLSASAREQYLATAEAERAVRTALVAGVATAYLQLATDAESLRLAESTLGSQLDAVALIRASRDAGVASDLDLRQAESGAEAARVSLARLTGALAADRHALELLLGGPLAPELLPTRLSAIAPSAEIASQLPSEVLLERPDIRAAEHRLRAANADIGAARAAFFPRISLTATLGTLAPELSQLFGSGTGSWSFVPVVQAPIFAGGGLRANLRATQVEREIAVATYEKAIQTAFAEVADALARRATLAAERQALDALIAALEETVRLSEARYRAGLDGYLGVLIARRSLFDAEQSGLRVRLAERTNRIALYRALGGGG